MNKRDVLLIRCLHMLRGFEWAAATWTDYATCPSCHSFMEGLAPSADGKDQGNEPRTHAPDCELVALVAELSDELLVPEE